MKRTAIISAALLAACAFADDLQIRHFIRRVDPANTRTIDELVWYAGESLDYSIYPRRGNEIIPVPAGATALWQVLDAASNVWIEASGTIPASSNDPVVFFVPAPDSNLPAGDYDSWVTTWQGTNRLGVLDRCTVEVRWRPGDDYETAEPLTNVLDQIVGWWADAGVDLAAASNALRVSIGAVETNLNTASNALAGRILAIEESNGAAAAGAVQTNLNTASNALALRIGAEETNRAAAVGAVQTNLNLASNYFALRIAGIEESNGLAAAGAVQTNLNLASNYFALRISGIEESNGLAAAGAVQTNLNAASNALRNAIGTVQTNLNAASNALALRIGAEETNRAADVGAVQTNLNAASNALRNAIGAVQTNLNAASNALRISVGAVETNLNAASNALRNASGAVQTNLNLASNYFVLRVGNEETNRALAIGVVETNLVTASNSLAARIADLEADSGAASAAVVQTNLNAASNALRNAIGAVQTNLNAASNALALRIGTEETNRAAADGTLQTNLNLASNSLRYAAGANHTNLLAASNSLYTAMGSLSTYLYQASNALRIAVGAAQTNVALSSNALALRIGTEETNRATADGTLQTNLNLASNSLRSGIAALSNAIPSTNGLASTGYVATALGPYMASAAVGVALAEYVPLNSNAVIGGWKTFSNLVQIGPTGDVTRIGSNQISIANVGEGAETVSLRIDLAARRLIGPWTFWDQNQTNQWGTLSSNGTMSMKAMAKADGGTTNAYATTNELAAAAAALQGLMESNFVRQAHGGNVSITGEVGIVGGLEIDGAPPLVESPVALAEFDGTNELDALPLVLTNTAATATNTSGTAYMLISTTNGYETPNGYITVLAGTNELETFYPLCDGTTQTVEWAWAAPGAPLTLRLDTLPANPNGDDHPEILTLEFWNLADTNQAAYVADTRGQIVQGDDPTQPRQFVNKRTMDAISSNITAGLSAEIYAREGSTDLQGNILRLSPRIDFVSTGDTWQVKYGGETVMRLDGEGAAVIPEIRSFAVEGGETVTMTVWSYAGGASNLLPEVTTNLLEAWTRLDGGSILSAEMIDDWTAEVVFTNSSADMVFVRLVDTSGGEGTAQLNILVPTLIQELTPASEDYVDAAVSNALPSTWISSLNTFTGAVIVAAGTGIDVAAESNVVTVSVIPGEGEGNVYATNEPTSGQMLYASSTNNLSAFWADAPSAGGSVTNLGDLADVSAAAPTNGHLLGWDSATSNWTPRAEATDEAVGAISPLQVSAIGGVVTFSDTNRWVQFYVADGANTVLVTKAAASNVSGLLLGFCLGTNTTTFTTNNLTSWSASNLSTNGGTNWFRLLSTGGSTNYSWTYVP